MRRALRRFAYVAYVIVAGLLLLEAVLIVGDPFLFNGDLQYDPELGFRVRPYALDSNRFGFNDADSPIDRVPGARRVVVLGDSYSWMGGRDCNYVSLLEQLLNTAPGAPVEVINTGYPMTGTLEQLKVLKRYGLQYDPDVLLLSFFAGNDFSDSDPARKRIVFNTVFADIHPSQDRGMMGFRLFPLWRGYEIVRRHADVRPNIEKSSRQPTSGSRCVFPTEALTTEAFLDVERHRLFFHRILPDGSLTHPDRVTAVYDAIEEMQRLMAARRGTLLVAILPAEIQVDDALYGTVVRQVPGATEAGYERKRPQRLLAGFLQEHDIPYIDLLDDFRTRARTARLFNERETHWNLAGNQLAAERLAPFVRSHLSPE